MTTTAFSESLAKLSLPDLMTKNVLTVYEGWSIKRLAGFFIKHGISGAPVVASDESLVGVVTQTDLVRFESREIDDSEIARLSQYYCGPFGGSLSEDDLRKLREKASENCTVNTIMTPAVCSIDINTPVWDACSAIVSQNLTRLFVTDKGQLVGVVTARDVMARLLAGSD